MKELNEQNYNPPIIKVRTISVFNTLCGSKDDPTESNEVENRG